MGKGRPRKCPKCESRKGSRSRGYKYYAGGGRARDMQCRECGKRYLVETASARSAK